MAKPASIVHKYLAVMCDGVQMHRLQKFGVSSDSSLEQTIELANGGVIEYKPGARSVSVSLDSNFTGETNNCGLVSDRIFASLVATSPGAVGANKSPVGAYGWYIKTGSSNASLHSISAQDLLDAYCDFVIPVTEDGSNVSRTMWVHRAGITNLNWSFDVNGLGTENYQFTANNKRWFLNGWKRAKVARLYPLQASALGAAMEYRLRYLSSTIPTGSKILYFCVNEKIYGNSTYGVPNAGYGTLSLTGITATAHVSTTVAGGLDTSVARTPSLANMLHVIYLPSAAASDFTTWAATTAAQRLDNSPSYQITSTAGAFGGTVRGNYRIWLVNKTNTNLGSTAYANVSLRLQNAAIDASLNTEEVYQLGQTQAVGLTKQAPVTVNITVQAKDSDLELFANMTGTSESNTAVKTFSIEDFKTNNKLVIESYRDYAQTTKIGTLIVDNMTVTGDNQDMSVGGDGNVEFSFTADNFRFFGTGNNVTGY